MKYSAKELAAINCKIRDLAKNHYRYGSSMPLVFGKARGISNVLETHYNIKVSIQHVWDIVETMLNEPQE